MRCFGVLGALPRIEYFEKRTLPAFSTDDLEARGIGRFVEGFRIGVYSCRVRCAGDKEGSRAKQDEIDCFFHKNPLKSLFAETGQVVKAGARRIVCLSSTYVAMLDALFRCSRRLATD